MKTYIITANTIQGFIYSQQKLTVMATSFNEARDKARRLIPGYLNIFNMQEIFRHTTI